jgi:hypothetical protein
MLVTPRVDARSGRLALAARSYCRPPGRSAQWSDHLVPFWHDQRGLAALVRAAEPSLVIERLAQLLVADAVVLVYLHRHAATRASIAIAGNDNRFALPTFRLVMLLPRRFCGLRTIEPSGSPIRLLHVADEGLSPIADVDVFDPNELVPSVPQSA